MTFLANLFQELVAIEEGPAVVDSVLDLDDGEEKQLGTGQESG